MQIKLNNNCLVLCTATAMSRRSGPLKTNLSIAVLPETRKMLMDKSEACGQTMSDLVQVAVVEKYSPRRGLANRLRTRKAEAELKHRQDCEILQLSIAEAKQAAESKLDKALLAAQELAAEAKQAAESKLDKSLQAAQELAAEAKQAAESKLDKALLAAQELAAEAKQAAESKLALSSRHLAEKLDLILAQCDAEWQNSTQKYLLDLAEEFVSQGFDCADCGNKLNRWLFDNGTWCLAGLNSKVSELSGLPSPRYSGSSTWHAYAEVFLSPMYKDSTIAADTAAELKSWTVTPEYFHFVLTHYEMSRDKLYSAFTSTSDSQAYSDLHNVLSEADALFSTDLSLVSKGCS